MSFGIHNLSNTTNATEPVGPSINESVSRVFEVFTQHTAGSSGVVGILALLMFGVVLWKSNVSMDVSAIVMIPLVVFLSINGFLPGGQAVLFGLILGIAGAFAYGISERM